MSRAIRPAGPSASIREKRRLEGAQRSSAEAVRFELTMGVNHAGFKTGAFNHSARFHPIICVGARLPRYILLLPSVATHYCFCSLTCALHLTLEG